MIKPSRNGIITHGENYNKHLQLFKTWTANVLAWLTEKPLPSLTLQDAKSEDEIRFNFVGREVVIKFKYKTAEDAEFHATISVAVLNKLAQPLPRFEQKAELLMDKLGNVKAADGGPTWNIASDDGAEILYVLIAAAC